MESWFIGREREREREGHHHGGLNPRRCHPSTQNPFPNTDPPMQALCVCERERATYVVPPIHAEIESNPRQSTNPRRRLQPMPPPSTREKEIEQPLNPLPSTKEREREEGRLRWEKSLGWEIKREVSQGEREIMNKNEYFILAIELQFHHKFRMVL